MFSLIELSNGVELFRATANLDAFEDWFSKNSLGWYDRSGDPLSDAIFLVRAALISYDDGEIDEAAAWKGLESATLSFVKPVENAAINVFTAEDGSPVFDIARSGYRNVTMRVARIPLTEFEVVTQDKPLRKPPANASVVDAPLQRAASCEA